MKTIPVFFSRNNYNRIYISFCCAALMQRGTIYITLVYLITKSKDYEKATF
jgi:hypothetical protein